MNDALKCRFCDAPLRHSFADLGMTPLANALIQPQHLDQSEHFYPLHAYVCDRCFLVQLGKLASPQSIFSDYAYFSSYSAGWLKHAENYVEMMLKRFQFDSQSQIIEIASNDGYLLQYFIQYGIPVLGIDPAKNVAREAERKGIPTLTEFFGLNLAQQLAGTGKQADLLIGNNVLAHVPDLNDFVTGLKNMLKPTGIITMEFPHLLKLMRENQFDTIYQEHFSYFSFITVQRIFQQHGLTIFDVEELPTHGGSLRILAEHTAAGANMVGENVPNLIETEKAGGLDRLETYLLFQERVKQTKRAILTSLIKLKEQGKTIVGYGAPAKGNTLLNYCGISTDFLDYTVDSTPYKQGLYLPGTRIPIYPPEKISATKPDYVIILPWNHREEIMNKAGYIKHWGGKFITLIPTVMVD